MMNQTYPLTRGCMVYVSSGYYQTYGKLIVILSGQATVEIGRGCDRRFIVVPVSDIRATDSMWQ